VSILNLSTSVVRYGELRCNFLEFVGIFMLRLHIDFHSQVIALIVSDKFRRTEAYSARSGKNSSKKCGQYEGSYESWGEERRGVERDVSKIY
jgi:hypothetical protein